MWSLIFGLFPSVIKTVIEAYNKHKDVELEKYKVDGTVDLGALQAISEVDKAQAQVLIAEQGKWYTPRNIMGYAVAFWFFKAVFLDKVFAPIFGFEWATDPLKGDVSVIAGIIVSGLFLYQTANLVTQRWNRK